MFCVILMLLPIGCTAVMPLSAFLCRALMGGLARTIEFAVIFSCLRQCHHHHVLLSSPVPIIAKLSFVLTLHMPASSSHHPCYANVIFANNNSYLQRQCRLYNTSSHNANNIITAKAIIVFVLIVPT